MEEYYVQVRFRVEGNTSIANAEVSYSPVGESWTKRRWETVPAKRIKEGWYVADVNVKDLKNTPVEFFATASDNRPVSVSSTMVWHTPQ